MEQTFSGIWVYLGRLTCKIPKNRNNRKILFHSTIPTRASFSEPGNRTTWRELLVEGYFCPRCLKEELLQKKKQRVFCCTQQVSPDRDKIDAYGLELTRNLKCVTLRWRDKSNGRKVLPGYGEILVVLGLLIVKIITLVCEEFLFVSKTI